MIAHLISHSGPRNTDERMDSFHFNMFHGVVRAANAAETRLELVRNSHLEPPVFFPSSQVRGISCICMREDIASELPSEAVKALRRDFDEVVFCVPWALENPTPSVFRGISNMGGVIARQKRRPLQVRGVPRNRYTMLALPDVRDIDPARRRSVRSLMLFQDIEWTGDIVGSADLMRDLYFCRCDFGVQVSPSVLSVLKPYMVLPWHRWASITA